MIQFFKSFLLFVILPFSPLSSVDFQKEPEPVVILGGGVGSLTSALYLGRAGFSPLVIEGPLPGGLLTQSHTVQNWPGVMEIEGVKLTDQMRQQAKANGARFLNEEVVDVNFEKRPFVITTKMLDGSGKTDQIQAICCIIAMGSQPNFLNIPGEQEYWGKGVTNCAICDGSLYEGKVVGVVGGGDAAILEALYLSNIAKQVYVFVRKKALKAIEEKRIEALSQKENVQFFYKTAVKKIQGDKEGIISVEVQKEGQIETIPLDGVFLAIGSTPNSQLFRKSLQLDEKGYIILNRDQETSLKGVFAIGDIVDPVYKQAISAAGDGAKAALQAQQYLSDRKHKLVVKKEVSLVKEPLTHQKVIEVLSVDQFKTELSESQVPVLVDFYASWCGPCKRVSPLLNRSAIALSGKVKFLKVDVDKHLDLSSNYNVRAMPTVLLFDQSGSIIERKVGFEEITDLLQRLDESN